LPIQVDDHVFLCQVFRVDGRDRVRCLRVFHAYHACLPVFLVRGRKISSEVY
jgi:hypothetical protein